MALIACAFFPAAGIAQEAAPRGMVVTAQDSIPMMLVGSCWDGICADRTAFFVPWDSLGVPEFAAEPGSVVNLAYPRPPDRITVRGLGSDSRQDSSGTIRLPTERGVYDYMIIAAWSEGDVVEGFRARIEE